MGSHTRYHRQLLFNISDALSNRSVKAFSPSSFRVPDLERLSQRTQTVLPYCDGQFLGRPGRGSGIGVRRDQAKFVANRPHQNICHPVGLVPDFERQNVPDRLGDELSTLHKRLFCKKRIIDLSGDVWHFFRCLGKDQRRRDKIRDLFGEILRSSGINPGFAPWSGVIPYRYTTAAVTVCFPSMLRNASGVLMSASGSRIFACSWISCISSDRLFPHCNLQVYVFCC